MMTKTVTFLSPLCLFPFLFRGQQCNVFADELYQSRIIRVLIKVFLRLKSIILMVLLWIMLMSVKVGGWLMSVKKGVYVTG